MTRCSMRVYRDLCGALRRREDRREDRWEDRRATDCTHTNAGLRLKGNGRRLSSADRTVADVRRSRYFASSRIFSRPRRSAVVEL